MTEVLDITPMLEAESDELVADSLAGGPITFVIAAVDLNGVEKKKLRLFYDGCNNRPWRPCKGMARILASQWGADAKCYIGKAVTVFRDPDSMYGGAKVGGVRLSAMSDIDGPFSVTVKEGRNKGKVFKIAKLQSAAQSGDGQSAAWAQKFIAAVNRAPDLAKLNDFASKSAGKNADLPDELRSACEAALADRRANFAADEQNSDWEAE